MSNTKLFYSYKDTNNTGKVPVQYLSYYSDSIIFDEDNRRLWHNGKQYGNTYWGTKHGETFNNIDKNYAYNYAHAEGSYSYAAGEFSHVEGGYSYTAGEFSHAEGSYSYAGGKYSHVEGIRNSAYGIGSHVEGGYSYTAGEFSHAEGSYSYAGGKYSHVEGIRNSAYGIGSHVEGGYSYTAGEFSHAEGSYSYAGGKYSHVEGIRNSAYGIGSHAEGSYSYAAGEYSHTQGLWTVAYNAYEAAFGKYNNSVTTGNKTIYSIGNGTSNTNRKNIIDFRENGDMHKNGSSYFHNNIYGPVSFTYVKTLGEKATLDIVLSSVLTEAEYKRPSYTFKFLNGENGMEYGNVTNIGGGNIIEVGSTINLYLNLNLSYYDTNNNTNGMSYGLSYCSFNHNNVNYRYTTLGKHNLGVSYNFANEGSHSMTDGKPISLCYLKSSYQGYPQLLKKGVYVPSKENWYNNSLFKIDDYRIVALYKYYYGWDADISTSSFTPKNGTAVWLPIINSKSTTTTSNITFNTAHTSFWFAIPINVVDNALTSGFNVLYHTSIGDADLVSTSATVTTTIKTITVGTKTHSYKVTKINFNKTISGASSNYVKFTMIKK